MDQIPYLDESPLLHNRSAHASQIQPFVNRLDNAISNEVFSYRSPYYAYYLIRAGEGCSQTVGYDIGPDPEEQLQYVLSESDWDDDIDEDKARFSTFFILCVFYDTLDQTQQLQETLDEYESEFEYHPYYLYLRSMIGIESQLASERNQAIEIAVQAVENFSNFPELQHNLAAILSVVIERGHTYTGDNSRIPTSEDDLIEFAHQYSTRAMNADVTPPAFLDTHGRLQSLAGQYEDGRQSIKNAITALSPQRDSYQNYRTDYRLHLSGVDLLLQERALSEATEDLNDFQDEINDKVNEIEQVADDVRDDLQTTTSEFRSNVLQFLGFFTGLLAIIITTTQIALSFDSAREAISLIIVSYGGLLTVFSGFSFILPKTSTSNRRTALAAISGLILLILGILFELFTSGI